GSDDPAVDAELITLLTQLLSATGVKDVRLRVSSLGSPDTRTLYREELKKFLYANEDSLSVEVKERIELNPLRAFDSDDKTTQNVMRSAPRLLDWLSD